MWGNVFCRSYKLDAHPRGAGGPVWGEILQRPATLVPHCQYFCIRCRIITLVRLKTRFCFSAEIVSFLLCELFCVEVLWDSKNRLHSTSVLLHHHHCNHLCYHHCRHHMIAITIFTETTKTILSTNLLNHALHRMFVSNALFIFFCRWVLIDGMFLFKVQGDRSTNFLSFPASHKKLKRWRPFLSFPLSRRQPLDLYSSYS